MISNKISSMVFEMMGFKASDTGRQFSFKYMFVESSGKIQREISVKNMNESEMKRVSMLMMKKIIFRFV